MATEQKTQDLARLNPWIRLLYLLLFLAIFNLVEAATYIVLVVQFIFHLFTGRPNERLAELGSSLASYARELIVFLTYRSDELPYPFGPWPGGAGVPATRGKSS